MKEESEENEKTEEERRRNFIVYLKKKRTISVDQACYIFRRAVTIVAFAER